MARKKRSRVSKARRKRAKAVGKKHCGICKRSHKHPAICRLKRIKSRGKSGGGKSLKAMRKTARLLRAQRRHVYET